MGSASTQTAAGPTTFGALVRQYRQAAALSQEALAERAQLSTDAISVIERGKRGAPRPETVALLAQALGLAAQERAAFIAAARSVGTPAGETAGSPPTPTPSPAVRATALTLASLPMPLTAFIGREREVAAICARLLEPQTRLLTLTGAGGVGKTRLAVQFAAEVLEEFPAGVFFVNLAPIADPDLVLPTIARALGVRDAGSQPLRETLYAFLRDKRLLLVLDNFEQVLAAAPLVGDLLAAGPQLTVLVTSRAPLRVQGEQEYLVPPLAVPDPQHLPPLEVLTQYDAVRLFSARAQQVKADFAVSNQSAPAVAEICARLDGLPLAIELAAARVRLFAPPALLARLGSRLTLLTGGARDLPQRQQTLRATLDWSYGLLTEAERTLFARLAVFVGGRTLEAIEAICNSDGALDVLEGVESLVEKSLLQQEEGVGGEPRLVMLETIHEYARERLAASGEAEEVRRRHAAYFVTLAEAAAPELTGPHQGAWLQRLEAEHDNLRAALSWSGEQAERELGLRLGGALWRFWQMHGHLSEGRRWLDAVLGGSGEALAPAWAKALSGAGALAYRQGDYGRATALHEEALALRRELGDKWGIANSLMCLGEVAHEQGDYERAAALYEEALALCRELGARWQAAYGLEGLAGVASAQGQSERAARLFGAAEATRSLIGAPLTPTERPRYERLVAAVRAQLDEETFAAAWAAGRALPLEQAIAEALGEDAHA